MASFDIVKSTYIAQSFASAHPSTRYDIPHSIPVVATINAKSDMPVNMRWVLRNKHPPSTIDACRLMIDARINALIVNGPSVTSEATSMIAIV